MTSLVRILQMTAEAVLVLRDEQGQDDVYVDPLPGFVVAGAGTMAALGAPDARLVTMSGAGTMWALHNHYFVLHADGEPLDGVEETRRLILVAREAWVADGHGHSANTEPGRLGQLSLWEAEDE